FPDLLRQIPGRLIRVDDEIVLLPRGAQGDLVHGAAVEDEARPRPTRREHGAVRRLDHAGPRAARRLVEGRALRVAYVLDDRLCRKIEAVRRTLGLQDDARRLLTAGARVDGEAARSRAGAAPSAASGAIRSSAG